MMSNNASTTALSSPERIRSAEARHSMTKGQTASIMMGLAGAGFAVQHGKTLIEGNMKGVYDGDVLDSQAIDPVPFKRRWPPGSVHHADIDAASSMRRWPWALSRVTWERTPTR